LYADDTTTDEPTEDGLLRARRAGEDDLAFERFALAPRAVGFARLAAFAFAVDLADEARFAAGTLPPFAPTSGPMSWEVCPQRRAACSQLHRPRGINVGFA
jgi:hypothetical protein